MVDSNAFSRGFDFNSEITVVSNDDRRACDCDLWPDVAWFHKMALYGKVDGIVWDVLHVVHGMVWYGFMDHLGMSLRQS